MTPAICGQRQSAARKRITDALMQATGGQLPSDIALRIASQKGMDAAHIATYQLEAIADAMDWFVASTDGPKAEPAIVGDSPVKRGPGRPKKDA